MLPVGAKLFSAEIHRQIKQDEANSLCLFVFIFFAAVLVRLGIVETRRVRHRENMCLKSGQRSQTHIRPPVNCLIRFVQFRPKLEYIDRNILKIPNRKFHGSTSDGSRCIPCDEQKTDRYEEGNSRFSQLFLQGCEKPQPFV